MTTRRGRPMLLEIHGRSRTRDGWWWIAPVWEKGVDASHARPEVRNSSAVFTVFHSSEIKIGTGLINIITLNNPASKEII